MNSTPQPQLLKLEEVFDETVKSGATIQEELKSAVLLRCVGGQPKSYLNFTLGDNVQYSTLMEQVLKGNTPMCLQSECKQTYQKNRWSKYLPIYESFNAFFMGVSNQLWGQDHCHQKRRAEALPAAPIKDMRC